jgi:hypothetical protein
MSAREGGAKSWGRIGTEALCERSVEFRGRLEPDVAKAIVPQTLHQARQQSIIPPSFRAALAQIRSLTR